MFVVLEGSWKITTTWACSCIVLVLSRVFTLRSSTIYVTFETFTALVPLGLESHEFS